MSGQHELTREDLTDANAMDVLGPDGRPLPVPDDDWTEEPGDAV